MPAREYRLTLEGELSDEAGRAFEGKTLACENGLTVLSGCLRDRAERRGPLQRVSNLGLTLLSATAVGDE
jgi:hypothetical protein